MPPQGRAAGDPTTYATELREPATESHIKPRSPFGSAVGAALLFAWPISSGLFFPLAIFLSIARGKAFTDNFYVNFGFELFVGGVFWIALTALGAYGEDSLARYYELPAAGSVLGFSTALFIFILMVELPRMVTGVDSSTQTALTVVFGLLIWLVLVGFAGWAGYDRAVAGESPFPWTWEQGLVVLLSIFLAVPALLLGLEWRRNGRPIAHYLLRGAKFGLIVQGYILTCITIAFYYKMWSGPS